LEGSVVFGFSSPDNIKALANSLTHRITTRFPPVIANTPEQTVSQRRIEEILQDIFSSEFKSGSRLGILARMKLAYAFKWKLREIGYDDKFVDFITKKLDEQLTHRTE
jgi:hypothetical protein